MCGFFPEKYCSTGYAVLQICFIYFSVNPFFHQKTSSDLRTSTMFPVENFD